MKESLLSVDFLLPLISITLMIFLMVRLYSLRNMSYKRLMTEFNIAFVLGKLAYYLAFFIILAYLIISFSQGSFLIPIMATVLGVILSRLWVVKIKLPPATMIAYPMMTFNCVLMIITFSVFTIYTFKLL